MIIVEGLFVIGFVAMTLEQLGVATAFFGLSMLALKFAAYAAGALWLSAEPEQRLIAQRCAASRARICCLRLAA